MAEQPAGMINSNGVVLSIGMFANGEAFEIVLPMVTPSTILDATNFCSDCVQSFENSPLPDLLACISVSTSVVFVAGEGMINGMIPYRDTFVIGTTPGTRGTGAAATNVAALGVLYEDPKDEPAGERMRIAKTFFSGIATADVDGNQIVAQLLANVQQFMQDCKDGWPSMLDGTSNWYRVLASPKPRTPGTPIKRVLVPEARTNVYSQKRRLVPRP